jgi:hypothetical protein
MECSPTPHVTKLFLLSNVWTYRLFNQIPTPIVTSSIMITSNIHTKYIKHRHVYMSTVPPPPNAVVMLCERHVLSQASLDDMQIRFEEAGGTVKIKYYEHGTQRSRWRSYSHRLKMIQKIMEGRSTLSSFIAAASHERELHTPNNGSWYESSHFVTH